LAPRGDGTATISGSKNGQAWQMTSTGIQGKQTHKNRWVRVGLLTDVAWHLEGLGRKASRL